MLISAPTYEWTVSVCGMGPALHQGRHASQEVGGDGGRNGQYAVAGDEPDDGADD